MDLIYCVEDDEGIRDLITYAVKSAGFEAEGFESASDFEKRLGERLPSMVLLDIMLPETAKTNSGKHNKPSNSSRCIRRMNSPLPPSRSGLEWKAGCICKFITPNVDTWWKQM